MNGETERKLTVDTAGSKYGQLIRIEEAFQIQTCPWGQTWVRITLHSGSCSDPDIVKSFEFYDSYAASSVYTIGVKVVSEDYSWGCHSFIQISCCGCHNFNLRKGYLNDSLWTASVWTLLNLHLLCHLETVVVYSCRYLHRCICFFIILTSKGDSAVTPALRLNR